MSTTNKYRKIIVNGKQLAVVVVEVQEVNGKKHDVYPSFVKPWLLLRGIEFIKATAEDYICDYKKRYGQHVKV